MKFNQNILSRGLFLVGLLVLGGLFFASNLVKGAGSVTVSATVASSVTCSTNIASTAFGTLTSGAVSTSSVDASSSLTCNDGLGCTLSLNDLGNGTNGGLSTSSPAYLIPSPNATFTATATLAAGTEGYGVQATTTGSGSGTNWNANSIYTGNFNGTPTSTNIVGRLSTTTVTLASSTGLTSGREVLVRHKAAISGVTQAATYSDTLTYSCVGN